MVRFEDDMAIRHPIRLNEILKMHGLGERRLRSVFLQLRDFECANFLDCRSEILTCRTESSHSGDSWTGTKLWPASNHTIFEGTSEIQQLVIAREISGVRIE